MPAPSAPIDRVTIRELTDDPGDEYFGDFVVGQVSVPAPIPEPATVVYLATGAATLVGKRFRKALTP